MKVFVFDFWVPDLLIRSGYAPLNRQLLFNEENGEILINRRNCFNTNSHPLYLLSSHDYN